MNRKLWIVLGSLVVVVVLAIYIPCLWSGEMPARSEYQVLGPIRHENLTIFPVVSNRSHDASQFLTLDEGLRSGEVVVSEAGSISPLVRPRRDGARWEEFHRRDGAEVNRLVLVNNSKRPLLLLAGEIVTGGKQDRVIGKDRIVPGESDPIDLSVFCVEPGRWVGRSAKFDAPANMGYMVQPSVRAKAMAEKDQQKVWDEVGKSRMAMSQSVEVSAAPVVAGTSSYAGVVQNRAVQQKIDSVAAPMEHEYQSVIAQLRDSNAVGVVVAVNGEIIWADVFASPKLLDKYWPKLVRSYATESFGQQRKSATVDVKSAQEFLDKLQGKREVVESEPGLYRHTEVSGDGFRVFELASLLPATGFDVHLAKMSE